MYLYLIMSGEEEGIFIFKNKDTGQLKQININLDYAEAEQIVKKLERVNANIRFNKTPERIIDRSTCQYCDFRHICLPDEAQSGISFSDDAELLNLLEARESLKANAKDYDEVDEKIKNFMKAKGAGEYLISGKYQIKVKSIDTTDYDVPKDIKEPYKIIRKSIRTEIVKL